MNLIVKHTKKLNGVLTPPPSKSQTIRALFIATLAKGTSTIDHALDSTDTQAAIAVCSALGASIQHRKNSDGTLLLEVTSGGAPFYTSETAIYTGDSGITSRFLLPILGLRADINSPVIVDCGDQMRRRPFAPLIQALSNLGMSITSLEGNEAYPVRVSGPLNGGNTSVDGITSQFTSALLISLPLAEHDSVLTIENLNERPYVVMTIQWLQEQGIHYEWINENKTDVLTIKGGQQYHPFTKTIPADFSQASYLIAAAAINEGEVTVEGLDMEEPQGDKKIIEILQEMGAQIAVGSGQLTIHGGVQLHGISIDCNDIPDLVPTLAVLGTIAKGKTTLTNVEHARLKETDRIHSMTTELKKMGGQVEERPDGMTISESVLTGTTLHGYNDHRTIMALAIAGLSAEDATAIDTAEGIQKTFPEFVGLMQSLGADMKLTIN